MGNDLSTADKQVIKKKIHGLKNKTDESQRSKWIHIFNLVFKMDKSHREHMMNYFWKVQGGKHVKKEKMKQFKKKFTNNNQNPKINSSLYKQIRNSVRCSPSSSNTKKIDEPNHVCNDEHKKEHMHNLESS